MSYTSPSPASIGNNGQQVTWWIPAVNLGTTNATNVQVQVSVSPSNGLQLITFAPPAGTTYNPGTGVWTIGNLPKGEANRKWLRLVTSVADIGLAPFTLTSVISGNGIDPNALNNTLVQEIDSVVCNPSAGAVGDPNSCNCVDVSLNDTACTHGVTEYRLVELSITNSTTYVWDDETGKGRFTHDDPTLPITFEYGIWCDTGDGFLETSGPATVTIPALIIDVAPLNHTIERINGADLTVGEIAVIQAQYPLLTNGNIIAYCWLVLKNADGDVTSAWKIDCTDDVQTRTFYLCTETECDPDPDCECEETLPIDITLPVDYTTPELGDTIILRHVLQYVTSVWVYNGANWVRSSCGCMQDAVPIDTIAFSGITTKTLTITFVDGTTKTATFTDLTTGEQTIEHGPCSISSGDGTELDPLIVNPPVPEYTFSETELTPGDTEVVVDVSTLFAEPCADGCTPTYTLGGYSTLAYENVTLVGVTLTYDVLATAPAGSSPIIINRDCA